LLTRINSANGVSAGFINPKLYGTPSSLRDITQGNNGAFAAAAGWDACTGLGSPNGTAVAGVLKPAKAAATLDTVKGSDAAAATSAQTPGRQAAKRS
jgi:hypothetical protein